MRPDKYILNESGDPVPCADLMEWARWFERRPNRVVKQEYVGTQFVSTVFLGLDHSFGDDGPPILYETMILGGPHDQYQTRCATREQALREHAIALAVARGERQPEPL